MGQAQSSNGGTPQAQGQPKANDYYELLGVERQATEEEIKKAYRRKALELHPDRNYGKVEEATKLFAEIQSAYEVLSDPHERAWYDSHRDVFLAGPQAEKETNDEFFYNIRMTTADDVLKLTMKYNGRVDYNDSVTGFYGGLQEFFGQLAKEEELACRWEDIDPIDYPDFGQEDDDYESVVKPFYTAWGGFATGKSYSWKDYYRLSEAPDRRVRRLLVKENKALREDAIREFNDAVRSLVAFVRKRDPRYKKNQKSEKERQKIMRDAAAAQSARSRAARQAALDEIDRHNTPDWMKRTVTEEHQGGFSSKEDSEQQEIECVVCNKTFKSEAQYAAHEKSKKHNKLLKKLQRELRDQDEEINNNDGQHSRTKAPHQIDTRLDNEGDGSEDHIPPAPDEAHDIDHREPSSSGAEEPLHRQDELAEDVSSSADQSIRGEDNGHDHAAISEVKNRLISLEADNMAGRLRATVIGESTGVSDTDESSVPKLGKAKRKRAKKAAQKEAREGNTSASGFKCAVCQADFQSKTKLFNHIKDNGHAAPVAITGSKGGQSKGTR